MTIKYRPNRSDYNNSMPIEQADILKETEKTVLMKVAGYRNTYTTREVKNLFNHWHASWTEARDEAIKLKKNKIDALRENLTEEIAALARLRAMEDPTK